MVLEPSFLDNGFVVVNRVRLVHHEGEPVVIESNQALREGDFWKYPLSTEHSGIFEVIISWRQTGTIADSGEVKNGEMKKVNFLFFIFGQFTLFISRR